MKIVDRLQVVNKIQKKCHKEGDMEWMRKLATELIIKLPKQNETPSAQA